MPHPRHYGLTHVTPIPHAKRLGYANAVRSCPDSTLIRRLWRRRRRIGLAIVAVVTLGPLTLLATVILARLIILWNGR